MKPQRMITLGVVPLDDVLCLIALGASRAPVLATKGKSWIVKICESQRIKVFGNSIRCVSCERVGDHFKLQRHRDNIGPHLNLFAADGVLMTKDHIVPKSKGGKDHMSNWLGTKGSLRDASFRLASYQTMF